ncbi:hypothetical protein CMUS01_03839 [Colletotrichum musicola]|uniref:C2H2-type domain-containing protein n=1 Tax=Colletotrichum musicola TaxID=2175873 RepID=A0A8H6NQL2_9PEZI|nr:hypothetical protein CMUS01_03839 [Colletotrichum musicola]
MTSYSDATRIRPDQHQQYVQGLASAISKKLGGLLNLNNRPAFFSALPDLVKAFAIRIGHEGDTHKNRAIMYFAHQYHEQIARQVENDCSGTETTSERSAKHGMSLLEKMDMWNKSPHENNPSTEKELFEGVEDGDEEEDEHTPVNLDRYDEIAFRSKAFEWLVSDLRRISCLKGYGGLKDTSIASIQDLIRQSLPTGRLRKTQGPRVHAATFKLGGWPSKPAADIFDSVVVTCFSGEAQATTIRHYMNQTWPSTGRLVLNLLRAVAKVAGQNYTTILPDETKVEASVQEDGLSVTVAGPANTIIECGEQLTWLRSAITPSDLVAMDRVPLLVNQQHASALSSGSHTFVVHALTYKTDVTLAQRNMWDKVLGRDVAVIRGFPILRRPHGFPGLELPLDVLLQWAGASAASIQDGLLQGSNNRALRLVKEIKNAPLEPKLPALNYLVPGSMAAQDTSRIQATQELNPKPVEIPVESTSLARPVCSTSRSSSSYLQDSTTSFDSDMDSTSDSSGTHTLTPLDDNDPMRSVLDIIANRLYSGFRSANGEDGQASSSANSSLWTPAPSGGSRGHAPSSRALKRKRADDDDQGSRKSRDLPSKGVSHCSHKLFACPFWKLNPVNHRTCFNSNAYPRLADVKQHLRRKHVFCKDPCCQKCCRQFSNKAELRLHLTTETCEYLTRNYEKGIVPEQHRELSKRAPSESSEEGAWFLMWDIVFPDKGRPSSAYIDSELSEDANSMLEYFKRHGERAYCEEATIAGSTGRSAAEQESDRERVLDGMFERLRDEWLSGRRASSGNASRANIDLGPPSTHTPADSGIVLGTQTAAANAPLVEPPCWDSGQPDMGGLFGLDEYGITGYDAFSFDPNMERGIE